MNFIINLYKPKNYSSAKVGFLIRKKLQVKKIGHLGTLDPLAEGVLPIFSNKYTKLIPYFQLADKSYRAVIELGADSKTLDTESKISYFPAEHFSFEDINQAINSFQGKQLQIAPLYSALKYKGKPSYYYAQKEISIPTKIREVTINQIKLLNYSHPYVKIEVNCSKGTYIRSLARDLGKKLNTVAILNKLLRIGVGNKFFINSTITLDEILINQYSENYALNPWNLLNEFCNFILNKKQLAFVVQGKKVEIEEIVNFKENREIFAFTEDKKLVASGVLGFDKKKKCFWPKRILL